MTMNQNLDIIKQGRFDRQDIKNPMTSLIQRYFERVVVFLGQKGAIEWGRRGLSRCHSNFLSLLRPFEEVNRSEERREAAFYYSQLSPENG